MNILPINKIILASFAFALTHWKKIVEISILPVAISLPLLLILPQMFELMDVVFQGGELTEVVLPDNTPVYLLLFFYGYIMLSVNMYRLVVLGEQAVSAMSPIFDIRQIFRFIGLTLFIGFVTTVPVMLTGIGFLQLVIYFLIMPITLNFVRIALHQPSNYKWQLNFVSQANLFLLQAIIPALIGMIFTALFSALGLSDVFGWIVKTVLFYWSLVNLALCYQLIQKANTSA
ncbi:hypothetical protein [Candidatus Thioglobus sp.]|jgi:hypothetical protein|uniref:hypothetical protein n=1 Tax=Candidatus Thioglobus sp. TaxID=2026721 RepID=UPI001D20F32E|nr:hypothetical protein [Candidatus Thioglobus sp.]MBT3276621.1 hypothetical protein [Candidatus Thioglobus sp.]MBT3447658.1 hypothetical protein [Candidatus Thioglobus sp.]MBT4001363.1 hypothetical protein [Candidatus Thioglobus sp.]MBT4181823.1 hypothetical protein [Candidatus Thioglobus sp.]MBT4422258.1 hypothetical protein [Candidatus Thioglobus sp.]